jgi:indole-3-glycerol phosphate synthase
VTSSIDFLDGMIGSRIARLARDFGDIAPADRERLACCARPPRDFLAAVTEGPALAVIAEVKRSSPSAGSIAPGVDASRQAMSYEYGGAAAISVLTEPEHFGGSYTDLSDVADAVGIPVLCKDFVVDPLQLFVARGHGADAVLLMASVLGDRIPEYVDLATTLGMTSLVEVHDMEELGVAWASGAHLIGVNSRNLRDLSVNPERARRVIEEARRIELSVVAESGVRTRDDVIAAAVAGADAVLVGEALMRAPFPEDVLEQLTGVGKGGIDHV